jgi:hypothetical protein
VGRSAGVDPDPAGRPPGRDGARGRSPGLASTIGGVLVGFDEQVWRRQPPAQERVGQVDRARTVVAPSGLTIELPEGALGDGPDRPTTRAPDR